MGVQRADLRSPCCIEVTQIDAQGFCECDEHLVQTPERTAVSRRFVARSKFEPQLAAIRSVTSFSSSISKNGFRKLALKPNRVGSAMAGSSGYPLEAMIAIRGDSSRRAPTISRPP